MEYELLIDISIFALYILKIKSKVVHISTVNISTLNISKMEIRRAHITVAINYVVTDGLAISIFIFDLGPF